jgi:hypothetical protein
MPKPEDPPEESTSPTGFTYVRAGHEREADTTEPAPEPQAQAQATSAESQAEGGDADYPEDGTIPDVKDWIGEDPDRAQEAYDREQDRAGGPRVTLVDYLNDLLADDDDDE